MKNVITLKRCRYPTAQETDLHGLYLLPHRLPQVVTFPRKIDGLVAACNLNAEQLKKMVLVVAESFAIREPMARHLTYKGPSLCTKAQLIALFITDCLLVKEDVMKQSLAMLKNGQVVGGAFNETLIMDSSIEIPFQARDFLSTIFQVLCTQQAEGIRHLSSIGSFKEALARKRVGHHFMIARGNNINGDEAYHLVSGTMARYRELSFEFVVTEATNAWTGAAIEQLGGVRVYFTPYRTKIYPGISPDGYLSDKDSGSMFYVLKIK